MSYKKFLEGFYKENIIGVYKLLFSSGHYYIGRSTDIHKRYSQHCDKLMKLQHHNKQVQNAYSLSNNKLPVLEILLISDEYFLNHKEGKIIEENKKDIFCLNSYGCVDRKPIKKQVNKTCISRKITIDELSRKEFNKVLTKYGTIDKALLRLLEIDI